MVLENIYSSSSSAQELKNAICYVNKGCFQLSVELTEKHLQKLIVIKSEFEEVSEVKRRLNFLDQSLNKLEDSLKKSKLNSVTRDIENRK